MDLKNKYMLACAILFIAAPIFLSTISSDNITATDWVYRHSAWIERYISNDYSPILEYPPMFHILMFPFVFADLPMKYFQVIFALLATFGILHYAHKTENEQTLLYTSILLASSIAFVMFAGSLMPQALDYLFFPLALIFYYQNRVKSCVSLLVLDFLMHGVGYMFIGILFMHSIITNKEKFMVPLLLLLMFLSPIFLYYNMGIMGWAEPTYDWDNEAQNAWEEQYYNPIWKFFLLSGAMTWVLLPFAIWKLYKNKFKITDTQLLYIIWILAFFSFIPFGFGYWRMISYQIVPLSLLVASLIVKSDEK